MDANVQRLLDDINQTTIEKSIITLISVDITSDTYWQDGKTIVKREILKTKDLMNVVDHFNDIIIKSKLSKQINMNHRDLDIVMSGDRLEFIIYDDENVEAFNLINLVDFINESLYEYSTNQSICKLIWVDKNTLKIDVKKH